MKKKFFNIQYFLILSVLQRHRMHRQNLAGYIERNPGATSIRIADNSDHPDIKPFFPGLFGSDGHHVCIRQELLLADEHSNEKTDQPKHVASPEPFDRNFARLQHYKGLQVRDLLCRHASSLFGRLFGLSNA